jgi:hypothetical protein
MSTAAQQSAALANAQLSTGPRSPEGKAAAARNSLKLGLHARTLLLPGEDPAELEQLFREFHQHYQPEGLIETVLVDDVVRARWLYQRYLRIENEVISARIAALSPADLEHPLGAVYIQDTDGPKLLDKIYRRQRAALRQCEQAMAELRAYQRQSTQPVPKPVTPKPVNTIPQNPVRFDDAPAPPAHTGASTPVGTASDSGDNPALRL